MNTSVVPGHRLRDLHHGVNSALPVVEVPYLLDSPCLVIVTGMLTNWCSSGNVDTMSIYLDRIDKNAARSLLEEQREKALSRRRVPHHIIEKVNKHVLSPQIMSVVVEIHSKLEKREHSEAWVLFSSIAGRSDVTVPPTTARKLLASLQADVITDPDVSQTPKVYQERLNMLLMHVQNGGRYWSDKELCISLHILDKLDDVERAEAVFRNMPQYCNEKATVYTFNRMASAYLSRLKNVDHKQQTRYLSKLLSLLHTMEKQGIKPDIVTFNILFSAHARVHNAPGIEHIFKTMKEQSIQPHISTLNVLLDAFGRTRSGHLQRQTLLTILGSLESSITKHDMRTYALKVRNAVLQKDMQTAEKTVKAMMDAGFKPNEYVFAHLVAGYVQANEVRRARVILDLMSKPPFNIQPNDYLYTPVMQGYAKANEYKKAYGLFSEMVDRKIPVSLATYTVLATMYIDSPTHEDPLKAINILRGYGKESNAKLQDLDETALSVLIEAHGLAGERGLEAKWLPAEECRNRSRRELHAIAVRECYDEIVNRGIEPDPITNTAVLAAYSRMDMPEAAWRFWERMKAMDAERNALHYNALMYGLGREKAWYPVIKTLFEEMVNQPVFKDKSTAERIPPSVNPDYHTYDILLHCAFSVSDFDSIRRAWMLPCRPQTTDKKCFLIRTYYYALFAMMTARDTRGAKDVYKEFTSNAGVSSTANAWTLNINKIAQTFKE